MHIFSLQWHFEIEAFSLELFQEYSRPERILERYLQRTPFSPEFSLESSPEPKKPSCHSRRRGIVPGILPGIFPEVEKTFVLCSPRWTMREVRSFLSASSIGKETSMKHHQETTSAPAEPSLGAIGTWALSLRQVHQQLAPHFARPEVRQHALLYLQALLSDLPRKNGWQIAEHAREARPYGMQRLLSRAVWDEDGVRDVLRALVCQALHPPPIAPARAEPTPLFPVLVIDESGFPKRGRHSAGVQPQYCGATGQVDNCQVGVFLSYVTAWGHALIDRELYLPQDWCSDLPPRLA